MILLIVWGRIINGQIYTFWWVNLIYWSYLGLNELLSKIGLLGSFNESEMAFLGLIDQDEVFVKLESSEMGDFEQRNR